MVHVNLGQPGHLKVQKNSTVRGVFAQTNSVNLLAEYLFSTGWYQASQVSSGFYSSPLTTDLLAPAGQMNPLKRARREENEQISRTFWTFTIFRLKRQPNTQTEGCKKNSGCTQESVFRLTLLFFLINKIYFTTKLMFLVTKQTQ